MPTSATAIWQALLENAPRDSWLPLQDLYAIVQSNLSLQPDDFDPDAPGSDFPRWQRNVRNVLQHRKEAGILRSGKAEYYIPGDLAHTVELVSAERARRERLWDQLRRQGGPSAVSPQLLRDLRVFGGSQGIWVDKNRTQAVTSRDHGVTVSVLHTGSHYPDDLAENGLIYHYPATDRPPARDAAEVEATKAAASLSIPLFVITHNPESGNLRDVRKGWVASFDDASAQFLIVFQDKPPAPPAPPPPESEPFQALQHRDRRPSMGSSLSRKGEFRFGVFKRYGAECAVCRIRLLEALDAVHIVPVEDLGTDDPRNGLPLCATHHRAFDAQRFAIHPETLRIETRSPFTTDQLRISVPSLHHLTCTPHKDALAWRRDRWISLDSRS